MFNLLDERNFLHIFFNRVGDVIVSNLLFLLCSIPIVTIGPSMTALYHTMLKIAKGDEGRTWRVFFRAFRKNFLQSLIIWLIILAAALITFADMFYFIQSQSLAGRLMFILSLGVAMLLILFTIYVFPVVAAFEGKLWDQIHNTFVFLSMRPAYTLGIAVLTVMPILMTYMDELLLPLSAFYWFFVGFGLIAYINSHFFFKLFRPFLGDDIY